MAGHKRACRDLAWPADSSGMERDVLYNAFISYSHAADDKLAPALQRGLHQLARPWYRLRALRAFRDKTSLAASPALWDTIVQALGESEWFLFLASPRAAQSHWVQQEIVWWTANRRTDRLLIVLTDGELAWDEAAKDFDWQRTSAVPPLLQGRFTGEPLYVDLRWARGENDLSLRHSQFRAAILDIAAPLHGRAKDELDGDDVRQHRRTRRLAWSVGAGLAVLAAAATASAVIAVQQRKQADDILASATDIIDRVFPQLDADTKEQVFALTRRGADHGDTLSMRALGFLYKDGHGVAQDYAKAREWFEKAAKKGEERAMTALGMLYRNGEGVAQDYAKAREWFEKAAEKGDALAMTALGLLYRNGVGVAQDYAKAREWFEKAAEKGDALAMTALGLLYRNGVGVAQDYAKAREWFEKAAEKGNALAMTALGMLYRNGEGVAQDYAKAREWFEEAADEGDASAMTALGILYRNGEGVAQDYAKAREWFEKAAEKGDALAKAQLEQLPR